MPHRVYQVHQGKMRTGWAPDGTHIGINAGVVDSRDESPIVAIDYGAQRLRRQGRDWVAFPAKRYTSMDIVWDPNVVEGQ